MLVVVMIVALVGGNAAGAANAQVPVKLRFLWIETGANLLTLSSRESIAAMLDKAKAAGFTHIVPEAKNAWGYVIFDSDIAPHIRDSITERIWPPNQYGPPRGWFPRDFDILGTLIEEAKARGIKVHVAFNCFSEGLNRTGEGRAFERPSWQSVYVLASRSVMAPNGKYFPITHVDGPRGPDQLVIYQSRDHYPEPYQKVPTSRWGIEIIVGDSDDKVIEIRDRQVTAEDAFVIRAGTYAVSAHGKARDFLRENFRVGSKVRFAPVETRFARSGEFGVFTFANAANQEAQNYELSIMRELVSKYAVEGIVFDRCRWWHYYADFSDENRKAFEEFMRRPVTNWPTDIFSYQPTRFFYEVKPGPLWAEWQGWRAKIIYQFFSQVVSAIREARPGIEVGNYVGGWYPNYWREGLNWGAIGYDPGFGWVNQTWRDAGTAELFDYLMVAAYYPEITEQESLALSQPAWMSVEGVANLARLVTQGKTKIINSLLLTDFGRNPCKLLEALDVSGRLTDGIMIFDHIFMKSEWWELFSRGSCAN